MLMYVDNQLKDVARGRIMNPTHRTFHYKPMEDSVHRVEVDRSFPRCTHLVPPHQPPGAEDEPKVGQLKNHVLLWLKALLRLKTAEEMVTPTSVPMAASQERVTPASVPAVAS